MVFWRIVFGDGIGICGVPGPGTATVAVEVTGSVHMR
jgi:hypothetical protein